MESDTNRKAKEGRSTSARRKAGSALETTVEPQRSGRGRPPRDDLTALQLRAISAIMTQPTMAAAAKQVGVHPRTMSRYFREPAFRKEYLDQMTELQLELWRQMLSVRQEGWLRFLELLRSKDERIALRASSWFLDRLLSAPPMLRRFETDEGPNPAVPPRLRAFLEDAELADGNDEDGAA